MNDLDFFADETPPEDVVKLSPWKILIVDDEPDIHIVTEMALRNFSFQERELVFYNAYSASEAKNILEKEDDLAIIFLDVVMETRDAGLKLVNWIREELKNFKTRIVLRTGQPGDAPESQVIVDYDISDYKEKSELTAKKLFSLVCSSLRAYQNFSCLLAHQKGMKKVIQASGELFNKKTPAYFIQSVLEEIFVLYQSTNTFGQVMKDGVAISLEGENISVLAKTGKYERNNHFDIIKEFGVSAAQLESTNSNLIELEDNRLIVLLKSNYTDNILLFFHELESIECTDEHYALLRLFVNNVQVAYDNLALTIQTEQTQKEIAYRLGEAIETRSKESGAHVKRVAKTSKMLALYYGLSEKEANILKIASPLHDIGKIAIPDSILHKPGKLDADEWEVMKTHAQIGEEMLKGSQLEIMQVAAQLAGGHHERWDGQGYPRGLVGEAIPIVARITAIADVFDALLNDRCYKKAWPLEDTLALFQSERAKQFDPQLVDLLIAHIDEIMHERAKISE